jgi:hypothetical protein
MPRPRVPRGDETASLGADVASGDHLPIGNVVKLGDVVFDGRGASTLRLRVALDEEGLRYAPDRPPVEISLTKAQLRSLATEPPVRDCRWARAVRRVCREHGFARLRTGRVLTAAHTVFLCCTGAS